MRDLDILDSANIRNIIDITLRVNDTGGNAKRMRKFHPVCSLILSCPIQASRQFVYFD
jgi:hypothetical protein